MEEPNGARGTHSLETASGGTSQDTKGIRPSEGYSHPGDAIVRDRSGHRKNPTRKGHSHTGDSIEWDKSGHERD